MRRVLLYALTTLVILASTPTLRGHLSFNLVVDARGNIYFIDVFKSRLMKVTPGGETSVLIDLRKVESERRLHALAVGNQGDLFVAGYHRPKVWRFSPAGKVKPFDPIRGAIPPSRGALHLGFDSAGMLYTVDWTYAADRKDQQFRVLRHQELEKPPAVVFMSRGEDADFVDFHTGSMIVTGDGTVFFSNANRIWKTDSNRRLALVAGSSEKGFVNGLGSSARFDIPHGMCADRDGSILVAERSGRIRRISRKGEVTTVAGAQSRGYRDGAIAEAGFAQAFGVAVGPKKRIHVVEYEEKQEYRIRVISAGRVTTLARVPTDGVFVN